MNKLFLLLSIGSIGLSLSSTAQENNRSVIFGQRNAEASAATRSSVYPSGKSLSDLGRRTNTANKATTVGGSRWYSYTDYLIQSLGTSFVGAAAPYMWNDTASVDAYSNGSGGTVFEHNTLASIGMSLDPTAPGFNDETIYTGIVVGAANAYTVDSVAIEGTYMRNYSTPAKIAVIDTMRITMVYGNGGSSDMPIYYFDNGGVATDFPTVPYGVDTLRFIEMKYDSLRNRAAGTTAVTVDVLLNSTDTAGFFYRKVAMPGTGFNVPAGNIASASFAFISGDPSFTFGDTVFRGSGSTELYKYGMIRPDVYYKGGTNPAFPTYDENDQNVGYFKPLGNSGWPNLYIPNWAFGSGSTASSYQYPGIDFHVNCSTCSTLDVAKVSKNITAITTVPNPADNSVAINFKAKTDATVTLTNALGQVVASQSTSTGNVVFNTNTLPTGVYIYTIVAGADRSTGRIAVAH